MIKYGGTGIPLHRKECTDRSQWNCTGIMGEILMAVREELRSASSTRPTEQQMEIVHTEPAAKPLSNEGCT